MTKKFKPALAAAGIAISAATVGALAAVPATAQVAGIATTVEPAIIIAQSTALQNAYQQISQTYQSERQQIETLQQQRSGLAQQLDTNSDGQLDDAEVAAAQQNNAAVVQQIQGLDQQVAQIQAPIQRARIYVVEQVSAQYNAAMQQVISDKSIQVVLSPEAVVYGPNADVTQDVLTALNARVPSVTTTVPADWQPTQGSVQTFQQVQQVLMMAALQQQQAAQQGQATQNGQVEGR